VDGLRVDAGLFVANCSYQKLSMVLDLEQAVDALAASDLIAALAGDPEATQALANRQQGEGSTDPDTVLRWRPASGGKADRRGLPPAGTTRRR
jgi:hypothetical protein